MERDRERWQVGLELGELPGMLMLVETILFSLEQCLRYRLRQSI